MPRVVTVKMHEAIAGLIESCVVLQSGDIFNPAEIRRRLLEKRDHRFLFADAVPYVASRYIAGLLIRAAQEIARPIGATEQKHAGIDRHARQAMFDR